LSSRLFRSQRDVPLPNNEQLNRENYETEQHKDEWQTITVGSHQQDSSTRNTGVRAMLGATKARCKGRGNRGKESGSKEASQ
jgi:hypothetical protein